MVMVFLTKTLFSTNFGKKINEFLDARINLTIGSQSEVIIEVFPIIFEYLRVNFDKSQKHFSRPFSQA